MTERHYLARWFIRREEHPISFTSTESILLRQYFPTEISPCLFAWICNGYSIEIIDYFLKDKNWIIINRLAKQEKRDQSFRKLKLKTMQLK